MASHKSIGQDGEPPQPQPGPAYSVNQLATHLPDQVVYADHSKQMPYQNTFQGVLMFLDISGFTALCEKYSMSSKHGTDQLTKTLNGYMNALVNEILQNDGDILKFAGDAILTLWPVDSFLRMKVTVSHVIMCAMSIQEKYGEWSTGVGVKLRVKIGIAAGEVNVVHLGNNEFCHYVTMGRAVESVNKAEKFCVSGDTVLSPSAWVHCAGIPVEHELLDDNKHHKVTSMIDQSSASSYNMSRTLAVTESVGVILEASEFSKKETKAPSPNLTLVTNKKQRSSSRIFGSIEAKSLKAIATPDVTNLPPRPPPGQRKLFKSKLPVAIEENPRVRKAIVEKFPDDLDSQLRLYVTQPVIRKMEEGQPLEYLSEMRSVTIVFINLIVEQCTKFQFLQTLQSSFNIIYRTSKDLQGCLNKVFMFDKGCTFLVIFGFPGLKHEKDCAHALQSAYRMKTKLDKLEKIMRTSIGTTTGSTFCGVVGHNHRHEYTVIGRKVNMAARLMMHYPGMVTCDNETFHHSKLQKGNFTQLDLKEMKGLQNVGIIREFIEDTSWKATIKALQKQEFESPLIGREREMSRFTQELQSILTSANAASQRQVIVFEGEAGIGKSRLLDAIIIKALNQSMNVVACSLTMQDSKTPYYVVTSLLMDLFEFDYETPHQEREHALFQMFQDPFVIENLPILNDLLHLKLPQCEKYLRMDSDLRTALFHDLLLQVVHEVTQKKGFIVFTVDDAHFMDPESWEFVSDLGRDMKSLVVLTLRTGTTAHVCNTAERILALPTTLHMDLHGLDSMFLAPLACQILGVVQIPKRLESFLQKKSQGVPAWCDQILREMFFRNIMQIEPLCDVDSDETMVLPKAEYLSRKRRTSFEITEDLTGMKKEKQQGTEIFEVEGKKASDALLVCVIVPGASLDIGIPDSIKGMIQARVDRMGEMDQLIIKAASVLGLTFPLQMLQAVLPTKTTAPKLLDALQRLGRSGIFESVESKTESKRSQYLTADKQTDIKSVSSMTLSSLERLDPILTKWRFIRFQSASIQETADGMLMEKIRITLHGNAAVYLESLAHKCAACGGGEFLPEHPTDERALEENATDAKTTGQAATLETSTSSTHRADATTTTCSDRMLHHGRRLTYRLDNVLHVDGQNIVESSQAAVPGLNNIGDDSQKTEQANIAFSQALKQRFNRHIEDDPSAVESTDTMDESDHKTEGQVEDQEAAEGIDMRECKCLEVLNSVYPQLIRHWRAAGNVERTMHFLMEAATAAIAVFNNMQALVHLREVSQILEAVSKGQNPFEKEVSHVEPVLLDDWFKARTESLLGQALFHMGNVSESFPHFKNALHILGTNIPKRKVGFWLATVKEAILQWKHRKFPNRYLGCDIDSPNAHYLIEEADCLSHIFHHNVAEHNKDAALLAALQQLNLAERAQPELRKLIVAYTCMMECCHLFNWPTLASEYEEKALVRCMTVLKNATLEDVVTTAHLYCTSLNMRLAWGKINDAIYAGYLGNRITTKLHENDIRMHLLPTLSQALMLAERIKDTVGTLKELDYVRFEAEDALAQAWYYASCLDLLLEAGFQLEPFLKCVDFAQSARVDPIFKSDRLPLYYLSCCLCVWFQRLSNPLKSSIWEEVANENATANKDNFRARHGFVKLVEARLIALAHAFYEKKRDKIVKLVVHVTKGMQELKTSCIRLPVFLPRYYHLQAYYKIITRKPSAAKNLLEKGIAMSNRMGNVLEANWMSNSRRVWFDSDPKREDYCFWSDQSKTNLIDWHLAGEVDSPRLKYVMPLPDWLPKIVL